MRQIELETSNIVTTTRLSRPTSIYVATPSDNKLISKFQTLPTVT